MRLFGLYLICVFFVFLFYTSNAAAETRNIYCVVSLINKDTNVVALSQAIIDSDGNISHRVKSYDLNNVSIIHGVEVGQMVQAVFIKESTYQPKLVKMIPLLKDRMN